MLFYPILGGVGSVFLPLWVQFCNDSLKCSNQNETHQYFLLASLHVALVIVVFQHRLHVAMLLGHAKVIVQNMNSTINLKLLLSNGGS